MTTSGSGLRVDGFTSGKGTTGLLTKPSVPDKKPLSRADKEEAEPETVNAYSIAYGGRTPEISDVFDGSSNPQEETIRLRIDAMENALSAIQTQSSWLSHQLGRFLQNK